MAPKGTVVVLVGLLVVALLHLDPSSVVSAAAATQQQQLTKGAASEARWATPGAATEGSTAGVGDSKQFRRRCPCCGSVLGRCNLYCCLNGQVIPAHGAADHGTRQHKLRPPCILPHVPQSL